MINKHYYLLVLYQILELAYNAIDIKKHLYYYEVYL